MTSRGASTIGELLDTTFTAYRKHAAIMAATAAVVLLPTILLTIHGGTGRAQLQALVGLLASVVATGQASEALFGGRPTLLGGLAVGLRRFVPALLCVIFFVVTAVAATMPFALLLWLANPRFSGFTPGGFVGALVTLLLLWAVAMSWLLVRYFALIPVATLEPGASAPDRSAALARGAYGRITLIWLIGGLIYGMPMMLVGGAQGLVAAMQDHGNAPVPVVVLVAVIVWIANSIVGPFSTLLNTALYYDRRAALGDLVVHEEPAGIRIAEATVGSLATAPSR